LLYALSTLLLSGAKTGFLLVCALYLLLLSAAKRYSFPLFLSIILSSVAKKGSYWSLFCLYCYSLPQPHDSLSLSHSYLLGSGELERAGLLGHDGALLLGRQTGHQPRDVLADLLGVQIAGLLRHINNRCEDLVVTLLRPLLEGAAGAADLNRQLLTLGVADILARRLLHVFGGAGGFVDGLAHLLPLPVALLKKSI
jgi:hypothetical protein